MAVAVALAAHPDNPAGLRYEVSATVARRADGGLAVGYTIAGDVARLRVPTPRAPAPAGALWRTTCCELFAGDGVRYREFNFSPSGQWAAYDFAAYRERAADPHGQPPAIVCRSDAATLRLDIGLAAVAIPAGTTRLGLSAVLETDDGAIGYWALAHAPGRPDFHHAAAFALALDKDPE